MGIKILMGIYSFLTVKDYWSVEEGYGNLLIQKAIGRERFWEMLQNMHFADSLQNPLQRDSEQYDRA